MFNMHLISGYCFYPLRMCVCVTQSWLRNDVWVRICYFLHMEFSSFLCVQSGSTHYINDCRQSYESCFNVHPMIKHIYRARKRFILICWHTYELKSGVKVLSNQCRLFSINEISHVNVTFATSNTFLFLEHMKLAAFWLKFPTSYLWHMQINGNSTQTEMLIQ